MRETRSLPEARHVVEIARTDSILFLSYNMLQDQGDRIQGRGNDGAQDGGWIPSREQTALGNDVTRVQLWVRLLRYRRSVACGGICCYATEIRRTLKILPFASDSHIKCRRFVHIISRLVTLNIEHNPTSISKSLILETMAHFLPNRLVRLDGYCIQYSTVS